MPTKKHALKVYVAPEEFAAIETSSKRAGLSLSTFAKLVCLGCEIPSLEQQQARREILKINADLGRLGGLVKQALANGADRQKVHELLSEIDAGQRELRAAARRIR